MAVMPLRRISVLGPLAAKRDALERLQELGCVHLIDAARVHEEGPPTSDEAQQAHEALRYLADCPERRHQVAKDIPFDMKQVVARALEIKQSLRDLNDRREFLDHRIGLLSLWGEFSLPRLSDIAGQRLWFYIVPFNQLGDVRESGLVWQEVNRDNQQAYIVVVSPDEPYITAMPVVRTHTGDVALSELREELQKVRLEIEDLMAERASLTRWTERLRDNLDAAEDRADLARAVLGTWSEAHLFAIQGWAPAVAIALATT